MLKDTNDELKCMYDLIPLYQDVFFKHFDVSDSASAGLNKTQIKCIMTIFFNHSCTMSEISKKIELEKGSFTPVAYKLIKLGYIEKTTTANDKRKQCLVLTEAGQRYAKSIIEYHHTYLLGQFNNLDEVDQTELLDSIKRIVSIMKKIE